jgi:antitoxin CcdA
MGEPAPKRSVNLSIRNDLLERARARKINLSKALDERLEEILRDQDRQAWKEKNTHAIRAANEFIEKHGLWSDGLRSF